ncbi:MAG: glycerophosphodiester phosphodiesterase family protein [Candidatus Marinimicrobia bacterium]|nr:glycerophosphodiester phosphodiesterase family protein [Candidatus Neomarinimicrobiota bacterium]
MKTFMKLTLLLVISGLLFFSLAQAQEKHYVSFETPEELQEYLRWTPEQKPIVSAHRGRPMNGFPENCIETFENALVYAPCLIECDVAKTKDSVLVMMHDRTLNRTTTGEGKVSSYTIKELKTLKLRDNQGNVTLYQIPTLAEVLDWARDKAIIELDIKKPVTPEEIAMIVWEKQAEKFTVVITYDIPATVYYHRLNPQLMISASAKGVEGVRRLLESGVDPKCLVAFVGVYEPSKDVYDLLHKNGIRAILGTMGNLDKKAEKRGFKVYKKLLKNGADILATDNVVLVTRAIEE